MSKMRRARLVCVGAACIDTILTVPRFPQEDSKMRATAMRKRRGGNTPNTLEVLQQLINYNVGDQDMEDQDEEQPLLNLPSIELFLIATLPARDCAESRFIARSFDPNHATEITTGAVYQALSAEQWNKVDSVNPLKVNIDHSIFREDCTEAVAATILHSESTSSRTIVNHNALPEMTYDEFVNSVHGLLEPAYAPYTFCDRSMEIEPEVEVIWFHFEGRIPQTTLACMQYLRGQPIFDTDLELRISVELEKPGREGLQALVQEADVIFYSKAWAIGENYHNAPHCLKDQAVQLQYASYNLTDYKALVCTWGEEGSSALVVAPPDADERADESVTSLQAYSIPYEPIVDSTGAGDTFIAGMLFGFLGRHYASARARALYLETILYFANHLASYKIRQQGFQGLGKIKEIMTLKKELEVVA